MIGKDPLRNLEGETAPCQVWERVGRVWPIRIDQPCRLCRVVWDRVVIDDAHQDPGFQRLRDALTVPRSTVNRQDELNAILAAAWSAPSGIPWPSLSRCGM